MAGVDTGPLAPGSRFGGVRIERVIARGGSSTLYLAIEEDTGTPVAVKALALADDVARRGASARESFERDARGAMALRHEGIVTIYGVASGPGLGCVVMELLAGSDLVRYTRPGHRLPEALVLEITARVAQALAHAHRHGIVHRDVKPANVMFDAASQRVTLTDFGLSRAVDAQATRSGMLLGSPAYMAPELLAGAPADARSDLYALGVLMFELLTGRLPFEGTTMGALLQAVATGRRQPIAALRPELPPDTARALDAALEPVWRTAPAERLDDGQAWARQLRQLAADRFAPPKPGVF